MFFTVRYNSGYYDWAVYTAKETINLIKAAEDYLDCPFPVCTHFFVWGKKEVWFTPVSGLKQAIRIGGVNTLEGVEIEYNLAPVEKPALLFHELGHYWFGHYFYNKTEELNWLTEGIVSFLPFAMYQAGKITLTDKEVHLLLMHWGLNISWNTEMDYPLVNDRRFEGQDKLLNFYYIKSFFIQYLLYLELGNELYSRFLRELLQKPFAYLHNNDLLILLSQLKKLEWNEMLTGWVFPGEYRKYKPADLKASLNN